jgi:hypothetical protein
MFVIDVKHPAVAGREFTTRAQAVTMARVFGLNVRAVRDTESGPKVVDARVVPASH